MIRKSGNRFSDKIMRKENPHDPEKWEPVSRLREALQRLARALDASAGEGRSDKIMREEMERAGDSI